MSDSQINFSASSEDLDVITKLLAQSILDRINVLGWENDIDALLKIYKFIMEV